MDRARWRSTKADTWRSRESSSSRSTIDSALSAFCRLQRLARAPETMGCWTSSPRCNGYSATSTPSAETRRESTIAGQSAGASAVLALLASPPAKGLFARAIVESGAGVFPLGQSPEEAQRQGAEFAEAKGATTAAALRALSADALIAPVTAQTPSAPTPPSVPFRMSYGPIVDGATVSANTNAGSDVPVLTGFVANEASALNPRYGQATPARLRTTPSGCLEPMPSRCSICIPPRTTRRPAR